MTMIEQACNLSGRKLTDYIPPTKFRAKTLTLDKNELMNIRNVKYCTTLRKLSVCHNSISDLSPVGSLPYLEELLLVDNLIDRISGVGECTELRILNLSRNCLRTFTGLYHCSSLSILDLSYNSIGALVDISVLVNLRELYLQGNEILCLESAPLSLPSSLRTLALADNRITDIGQLAYLTRLKSMSTLTLGGNECSRGGTVPYQLFAVMCCPNLHTVDGELISDQHREHARDLVKHMRITGDSNFSPVRESRTTERFRSKSVVTRRPKVELDRTSHDDSWRSKENIIDRTTHDSGRCKENIIDQTTYDPVRSKENIIDQTTCDSVRSKENIIDRANVAKKSTDPSNTLYNVPSVQGSLQSSVAYTAYDEYNDRPAASGTPRTHKRRSSEHTAPQTFSQIIVPRERSVSVYARPTTDTSSFYNGGASKAHAIVVEEEVELDCVSTYIDVETSIAECLDTDNDDTCSQSSLSSYVMSSQHDGASSQHDGASLQHDGPSSQYDACSPLPMDNTLISIPTKKLQDPIYVENKSPVSPGVEKKCGSAAFFVGLEESNDSNDEEIREKKNQTSYFIDLEVDGEQDIDLSGDNDGEDDSDLSGYNLRHSIAATCIQAVWKGILSRRRTENVIKELGLRRYKRYCDTLTATIHQLNSALVKEQEVSILYRTMITNLCQRVKSTQSQRTRSANTSCQTCLSRSVTQNNPAPTLVSSSCQTEGILNSLFASFSSPPPCTRNETFQYDSPGQVPMYDQVPVESHQKSDSSHHTPDTTPPRSHKSSFSELMIHKRTSPPNGTKKTSLEDSPLCKNNINNTSHSNHIVLPSSNSENDSISNININCTKNEAAVIIHTSPISDDLYNTPQYENNNIEPPLVSCDNVSESVGVGGVIRNTLNMVKSSFFSSKSDDLDVAKESINNLDNGSESIEAVNQTNNNGPVVLKEEDSPGSDLSRSLQQFKSVDQLLNESQ